MNYSKVTFLRLLILAILLTILSQAIHETGHLLVYNAYQRNPTWGFIGIVQIWEETPKDSRNWREITIPDGQIGWLRLSSLPNSVVEKILGSAAGPVFSLLSVIT